MADPDWAGDRPILTISRQLELGLNLFMAVLVLAAIFYAVKLARKERRLNPIYILIGGTITVFYEPLGDLGAHVTFHNEQVNAVSAYGYHVPTWMIMAYTIAVGTSVMWMVDVIRGGVTPERWWRLYAITLVVAMVFELPLIFSGAIRYYPPQSLSVFGYPIWMAVMNCTGLFFVPGTIIYLLTEHRVIPERHAYLLVPLTPLLVAGAHSSVDFIRSHEINGGNGQLAIETASLVSIGAALLVTWLCARVVTTAGPAGNTRQRARRGLVRTD